MSLEHIGNGLYLTPSTAKRWRAAGRPPLTDSRSAWRSRAMQQQLRNAYLNDPAHHPYAAPPGSSNHEKGAAFDTRSTSALTRLRCRLAGLIRDTRELWHQNDPDAARMPIIPSLATAGVGTPILIGDDMTARMFHQTTPTRRIVLFAGDSCIALGGPTANSLVPLYGPSKLVPAKSLAAAEAVCALIGKANAERDAGAVTAAQLALVAEPIAA